MKLYETYFPPSYIEEITPIKIFEIFETNRIYGLKDTLKEISNKIEKKRVTQRKELQASLSVTLYFFQNSMFMK